MAAHVPKQLPSADPRLGRSPLPHEERSTAHESTHPGPVATTQPRCWHGAGPAGSCSGSAGMPAGSRWPGRARLLEPGQREAETRGARGRWRASRPARHRTASSGEPPAEGTAPTDGCQSEKSGRGGTAGRAPRERPELPPRSRSSSPQQPRSLPGPRAPAPRRSGSGAACGRIERSSRPPPVPRCGHSPAFSARPRPYPAGSPGTSCPPAAPREAPGPVRSRFSTGPGPLPQPRAVPLPPGPAPRRPARAHRRHWFSAPGGTAPTGPAVPPRPRLGTAAPGGWGAVGSGPGFPPWSGSPR